MKRTITHVLAVSSCVLALAASASAQSTWHVDVHGAPPGSGTQADPYTGIQYAIVQATTVDGDTLLVAPGTYVENLYVSKLVLIEASGGPDVTRLSPSSPGALVTAAAPDVWPLARLHGFTLDGSAHPTGTGIVTIWGSTLRIRRCVIREFSAGRGAHHHGGFLDAFQSTFSRNAIGVEIANTVQPGMVSLIGCIVRENDVELIDPTLMALNVTRSNVPANYPGGPGLNNVHAPAGFWDRPEGDLHLAPGSSCIDTGGPFLPPDPDGSPADIGAYPYDPSYAPGPNLFCTAKTNSQGCVPQIGFVGEPTSTGSLPFSVTASQTLPGKVGLLFYGPGKRSQPFQGGTHCVKLPTKRIGVQVAGGAVSCGGTYGFDFAAHLAAGVDPQLVPGALIACQWWSRDPLDVSGFGTGLTDALYFGVAP